MTNDVRNLLLVPAALLVLAILPLPYTFYAFLRMVVCLSAAWLAFIQWDTNKGMTGWAYIWVCMAVLFNPLIPVHLARGIWFFLDLAGAAVFAYYWRLGKDAPIAKP
ncbi:DUF6804 family protein [Neorhizobium sp. T7_12]|uniref:DUF6804 family protein n=1 Tax=Neorhizobium sp. T7_12 TaxID=2093832 RepID=UPI000CF8810E|nr:DUF6804 family protein [Neorhizobium sp. T7_12]